MSDLMPCPKCSSKYTYEYAGMCVCPECAYEWSKDNIDSNKEEEFIVKDANGNVIAEGDSVTLIKDLKVKGSSTTLKVGTKVKILRLVDGDHDIDCKIDGMGSMMLKSEFVKKAKAK
jgi:protein PhnA